MRRPLVAILVAVAVGLPGAAAAKDKRKRGVELRGAKLVKTIAPQKGFIDDPFEFDGAGGRLAYVNADTADLAEIIVFDLVQSAKLYSVDISAFTKAPQSIEFAADGDHFFVTARETEGGPVTAALLSPKGKVLRKFGPADHIGRLTYDGVAAVSMYTRTEKRAKRGPRTIQHTVEVRSLEKGKRLGKKTTLVTDLNGFSKKLDFTLKSWSDEYTLAVGIKGGKWDRREDQRSPDVEGWYDLPQRTFSRKVTIKNLIEHTKKMQVLSDNPNLDNFVRVSKDLSGLQRVKDGAAVDIELALPFDHYDHTTLEYHRSPDGSIYFTLQIDPVNPAAVERKRADKEWLDLYYLAPGSKKATRKARMRVKGKTHLSWRATASYWIVVPHHVGFDRGGKVVQIYALGK